jgi:hypothetical protein
VSVSDDGEPLELRRLALEHLGLVVSLGVMVAAGARVMLLARGDIWTAQAVLRYMGPATILLGLLPLAAQIAHVWLTIELFMSAFVRSEVSARRRAVGRWGFPLAAFVALFVQPVVSLVPVLGACAVEWTGRRRRPREDLPFGSTTLGHAVMAVVVFGALALLPSALVQLPIETLVPASGDPVIGYVLRDGAEPLVVLTSGEQRIVFVEDRIEERFLCATPPRFSKPLLLPVADYPPCG